MKKILSSCLLFYVLACTSCEKSVSRSNEDIVAWPEITRFDDLAFRADGLVRVEDLAAVRDMLVDLLKAGDSIKTSTIPQNVANPEQVELFLADLLNLIQNLGDKNLDDLTLKNLILGLHPVIEKIIVAAEMPHIHANEGSNSGFLFPIFGPEKKQVGTAEIKLHDDAGDIEVWLMKGGYGGEPWLIPSISVLSLEFPGLNQKISLSVRDHNHNQDESGTSTIVNGKTNYFVFPGESGVDPSWLIGADFAAKGELIFLDNTTGSFVLRPHVHREAN